MEPKLFKTGLGQYIPASWSGRNEAGALPLGDRVLVKPDKAAEITQGGITIPQEISARHSMAAEAGVVVAVGDGAFKWNSDKVTPYHGRAPNPGERVAIEKFAGQLLRGDDGEEYRLMESACIGALIEGV